ncbi:hypothetical protein LCGC14_0556400 [marine sediment metagenome]|uniref:ArnR1-like winged helix-turn-helix domain-containing protein n=1 Tax=marine sediment metagenome TaxID=412755 RepID=A0A0F9S6T1_9ZZZZ
MRKVGVNFLMLKPYLKELISLELVEKRPYREAYRLFITSKGQEVNHHFFITDSIEREFGLILYK